MFFKPAAGVRAIRFSPSHTHTRTHSQVKLVDPLPSRGIVYLEQAALEWFILDPQLGPL